MKITKVEAITLVEPIKNAIKAPISIPYASELEGLVFKEYRATLVKVETDEGITGWGECMVRFAPTATRDIVNYIAPLLIVYASSIRFRGLEVVKQTAQKFKDNGFKSMKIKIGQIPENDMATVRAVREVVGPDIGLTVDANCGYDVKTALRVGKVLEERLLKPADVARSEVHLAREPGEIRQGCRGDGRGYQRHVEIEAAKAACHAMAEMCKDIGLPARLSEVGVAEDKFEQMAKDAIQNKLFFLNPCKGTVKDLINIYKSAY